jgi:hypothetical protein
MHHYFYLLPAADFHRRIRPVLTASWQQHSFAACRDLCAERAPRALAFRAQCGSAGEEPLLCEVARGVAFDRTLWKLLVGELLTYSATEIPLLESSHGALCRLLDGEGGQATARRDYSPIQQVHNGARDLHFGGGYYRPEHAGYNDTPDVMRLSDYLGGINPEDWDPDGLAGLPGCESEEDRADELELARDWFPSLRALYRGAGERGQVIVCESL